MTGWCVDRKGGHVVVIAPDGTEDAACSTFLDRLLLRGLSLHTVEAYAYDLVLMKRWLEASRLQLAEMNSGHLHEFLAWERGRDSSPKSINRRLHTLRLFFRHVSERELPGASVPRRWRRSHRDRELGLQRIPARDSRVVRVKEPRTIVEPLTVDQVNELLHSVIEKYTRLERPPVPTLQVFVVLQGTKRGQPIAPGPPRSADDASLHADRRRDGGARVLRGPVASRRALHDHRRGRSGAGDRHQSAAAPAGRHPLDAEGTLRRAN